MPVDAYVFCATGAPEEAVDARQDEGAAGSAACGGARQQEWLGLHARLPVVPLTTIPPRDHSMQLTG